MRASGLLLHISSLPGSYGIGSFGREAYEFIDFLKRSGQRYWQVLPLGPTGYGDSPYQVISAFAGNPYFIDLEELADERLLTEEDLYRARVGSCSQEVDYEGLFNERIKTLRKAFGRLGSLHRDEIEEFKSDNEYWIDDYALYMAIKEGADHSPYYDWSTDIVSRDPATLKHLREVHLQDMAFWTFVQYVFHRQWKKLKNYAGACGVKIIGDLPIYVGRDSVDLWANPHCFCLDENHSPKLLSGVPPDDFSSQGQFWGTPLFDWERLREDGYLWWVERLKHNLSLFDTVRIDHFRGFESYWAIPATSQSAASGTWVEGPGIDFFNSMRAQLEDLSIIAEDLGFLTDGVRELRKGTGYPGMKILQFAFNGGQDNEYLPHNYEKNSVVYTGTHDNDTITGWRAGLSIEEASSIQRYANACDDGDFNWEMIRLAMASTSNLAIFPVQDILGLDSRARMNTPSLDRDNWKWRMKRTMLCGDISKRLLEMTILYGR